MTSDRCLGKRKYLTWTHAAFDAKMVRDKSANKGEYAQPYRCKECGKFHVGGTFINNVRRRKTRRRA